MHIGNKADIGDALIIPGDEILLEVLAAYIAYVHPHAPFLDLSDINSKLVAMVSVGTLSPFVLQSMLAAAWQYVPGTSAGMAGFSSPRDASAAYLQKAQVNTKNSQGNDEAEILQTLLKAGWDIDARPQIQGLLLLSFADHNHPQCSEDDVASECSLLALRLAQKIGLHLSHSYNTPLSRVSKSDASTEDYGGLVTFKPRLWLC